MVKNLLAMQETRVQSLGWENPLEKGVATHSSILGWRISWTEEPGRLLHGVTKSRILLSKQHFHSHQHTEQARVGEPRGVDGQHHYTWW